MNGDDGVGPFVVKSVRGSCSLEFSGPVVHGRDEYDDGSFMVALRGGGASADGHVVDVMLGRWTDLFRSMAREWRGWDGAKEQSSSEGDLVLSCTADALGHVFLRATLRGDFEGSDWLAEETIVVEAGQLDDLAATAAAFFGARS